jgi:hypothetical protein
MAKVRSFGWQGFAVAFRGERGVRSSLIRLALASSLLGAGTVALSGAASARHSSGGANNYFVAPTGIDTSNTCANHSFPCQTITHALAEQGLVGNGGTIHLARGTYTTQVTIGALNSSVTIVGASAKKTIIQPPASGLSGVTDPNSANPVHAVVEVTGGANSVNLQKLTVNGTNGVGSLDTDGQGCAQSYVGIYVDNASGTVTGVSVTGMDVPLDQIGTCTSGRGIYAASDATGSSFLTLDQDSLAVAPCTTSLNLPLASGPYTNAFVGVKGIKHSKTCKFTGGPVLIDGALLMAEPFGNRTIEVTGTMPYQAPGGSTVSFNPLSSAYDAAGIVCENATTTCTIDGAAVEGIGPNDQVSQNGIEILGASATVGSSKVSQNSFAGGGAGSASDGIKVLNGGTLEITGNTVTDNDVDIGGTWNPSLGVTDPTGPRSAGRVVSSSDGVTTTGQSTLTSATAAFQLSDVGRSVSSSFAFPDGMSNVASSFSDGVANGTNSFTSLTANFTAADQGQPIVETDALGEIPPGTTIAIVNNATTVTLSHSAPSPAIGVAFNLPSRPTTFTSVTADFTAADVGQPIVEADAGTTIPTNTTVTSVLSTTSVLVSNTLTGSASGIAFTLPARPTGIAPGSYIAGFVSPEVVILSQPATETVSGLSITLGALPGTWTITGNTASSATSLGASAGIAGYGNGIELDSTDGCADANENADVVVQGNTALDNAQAGISLLGASCSLIGGPLASQANKAIGNHVGLELSGPGSDCSPCSGTSSPGWDSKNNVVSGDSFTTNSFGLLAHGLNATQSYGGPPSAGDATSGNTFNANTWSSNSVANAVDFTGWAGPDISGVSFTLGATPAGSYTTLTSTTAKTLTAGQIIVITQSGLPTLNVLVSSSVTGATTIPVTPFTATGDYTGASAVVSHIADAAPTNTYGVTTHDSCDPSPNGSASFDGFTFSAGFYSC